MNPTTLELVTRDFKVRLMYLLFPVIISRYRLMVIDNDYLNYLDCSVNDTLSSPVVMITNPPVLSVVLLMMYRMHDYYQIDKKWNSRNILGLFTSWPMIFP